MPRKKNSSHSHSNIKTKRKPKTKTSKEFKKMKKPVKMATSLYLSGGRDVALSRLSLYLKEPNLNVVKHHLKDSIQIYLNHYSKEFESPVEIQDCISDVLKKFNLEKFIECTWKHEPFRLTGDEFQKIRDCAKQPIHVQNYDYSQPIYKLANNITYKPCQFQQGNDNNITRKNDIKIYLSDKEDILFAKFISLRYKPSNFKAVKNFNKQKTN